MNGVVQDNRNSFPHREVRYDENTRLDGIRIGNSTPVPAHSRRRLDQAPKKVPPRRCRRAASRRAADRLTNGRGVLVIDRGGDAIVLLGDRLDHEYRFMIRLRGDRDLMRFAERLIALGQPLPDQPDFLPYRLLTGLTEAITTCFYLWRNLL